jgi:hypothetical protein
VFTVGGCAQLPYTSAMLTQHTTTASYITQMLRGKAKHIDVKLRGATITEASSSSSSLYCRAKHIEKRKKQNQTVFKYVFEVSSTFHKQTLLSAAAET